MRQSRLLLCCVTLLSTLLPFFVTSARPARAATAGPAEPVEMQSLLTDEWGVRRPVGLAYWPKEDSLLVAGTEAADTKVIRLTPFGDLLGRFRLPRLEHAATLAFDGARKRLAAITGSEPLTTSAGELSKSHPNVHRTSVADLGLRDPQGATFDKTTGTLYVLDDELKAIVRVPMSGGSPGSGTRISLEGLASGRLQGLALNPRDGLLYVASPGHQRLYALSTAGQLRKTYDLAGVDFEGFGLQNIRAMVFAPSTDPTDNPNTQHLFIADAGGYDNFGGVSEVSLTLASPSGGVTSQQATETGTLVQTIQTSQFNPPSPDPSGIVYLPTVDRLLISDAEVEEMTIFQGVNLWQITRTGTVVDTGVTTAFSNEPTGVAFNPADGTLFVSDDGRKRVTLIRPGQDGRYGTSDDVTVGVIDTRTPAFGATVDAEDVVYDPNSGHVFIVDGVGREVWRVDPGPNGTFGNADDVVTHFDVGVHGILNPGGGGFVAARDNLLILDNPTKTIYEITKMNQLVREIDVSGVPGIKRIDGVTLAPGTNDPTRLNMWIVDRVVDNNANPNENDGRLYEISWPSAPLVGGQPQCSDGVDNDGDGLTDFPDDPGCTDAQDDDEADPAIVTLDRPIAMGSDDAEESSTGAVVLSQAALDLVNSNGAPQTVGLRFTGVTVPAGATVANAYVQFQTRSATSSITNLTIRGEASDNASTFTTAQFNVSSRPMTTASVPWSPPPWTVVGEAGPNQRTPDLALVLQEIFDRPGWTSGNALALIVNGSGRRIAEAFEGARAPVLHVEYTTP